MAMIEPDNNDRAGLAAEYVLGTLDEAETARAEALIRSDRVFAAEVEQWRKHFDVLLVATPAAAPPPDTLSAILSAIGKDTAEPSAEIIELRRKVAVWKWTAGAAAAVAASLLALIFIRPAGPLNSPQFVAVLVSSDKAPAFIATADLTRGGLFIQRIGPGPAPGRSFELWAIRDGTAPQSLGVVDQAAHISGQTLVEKTGGEPLPGILLAITEEQLGGSPEGKPSGTPIFTGKAIQTPSL
jgi:anti-sigma-K factor RskA